MNKTWNDRADKDLFFAILSLKNVGVISGAEWAVIGNAMRSLGHGFTNAGCRQHFQGLRRASQNKVELAGGGGPAPDDRRAGVAAADPTQDPITRRARQLRKRRLSDTGSSEATAAAADGGLAAARVSEAGPATTAAAAAAAAGDDALVLDDDLGIHAAMTGASAPSAGLGDDDCDGGVPRSKRPKLDGANGGYEYAADTEHGRDDDNDAGLSVLVEHTRAAAMQFATDFHYDDA